MSGRSKEIALLIALLVPSHVGATVLKRQLASHAHSFGRAVRLFAPNFRLKTSELLRQLAPRRDGRRPWSMQLASSSVGRGAASDEIGSCFVTAPPARWLNSLGPGDELLEIVSTRSGLPVSVSHFSSESQVGVESGSNIFALTSRRVEVGGLCQLDPTAGHAVYAELSTLTDVSRGVRLAPSQHMLLRQEWAAFCQPDGGVRFATEALDEGPDPFGILETFVGGQGMVSIELGKGQIHWFPSVDQHGLTFSRPFPADEPRELGKYSWILDGEERVAESYLQRVTPDLLRAMQWHERLVDAMLHPTRFQLR